MKSQRDHQQLPTTLNALQQHLEKSQQDKEVKLPNSYQVKPADVICVDRGSTKQCNSHVGNNRFRILIELRLERYKQARNRNEKSDIVKEIVDAVRDMGGGFIHCTDGEWHDIGNTKAREKVSNAVRAALRKSNQAEKTQKQRKGQDVAGVPNMSSAVDMEHTSSPFDDTVDHFDPSNLFCSDDNQGPNSHRNIDYNDTLVYQQKLDYNFKPDDSPNK